MESDGGQLTLVSASAQARTRACPSAQMCAGTASLYGEAREALFHPRSWEVEMRSGACDWLRMLTEVMCKGGVFWGYQPKALYPKLRPPPP